MRLIDADALEKAIYKWMPKYEGTWMDGWISPIENLMILIMMTIQEQPTVDAEPVRHGRWIPVEGDDMFCCCSECGTHEYKETIEVLHYDYCPYCGAKMDAEREEE